jgi:hypothetical protein
MIPDSKRSIAVEDLLRLKTAEKPKPEFWAEFDQQLRAKQLSALVAKKPWWQSMPRAFTSFSRYHLSLGASALLAAAFLSLREYRTTPTTTFGESGVQNESVTSNFSAIHATEAQTEITSAVNSSKAAEQVMVASAPLDEARYQAELARSFVPESAQISSLPATSLSRFVSHVDIASAPSTDSKLDLGVSRLAAANQTGSLLVAAGNIEDRPSTARGAVEPLQQITPPSERSRAKLVTAMLSMSAGETTTRQADQVASKLSEERLYDQIHRFGARGAGVSMKF